MNTPFELYVLRNVIVNGAVKHKNNCPGRFFAGG